jgi:hypothetical protein
LRRTSFFAHIKTELLHDCFLIMKNIAYFQRCQITKKRRKKEWCIQMQKKNIRRAAAKVAAGIITAGTAIPAAAVPAMADSAAETQQNEKADQTGNTEGSDGVQTADQGTSALSVSLQTAGSSQVTLFKSADKKAWLTEKTNFYTEPSLASESSDAERFTEVKVTGESDNLTRIEYSGKTYYVSTGSLTESEAQVKAMKSA